jgi:hypothetical protein
MHTAAAHSRKTHLQQMLPSEAGLAGWCVAEPSQTFLCSSSKVISTSAWLAAAANRHAVFSAGGKLVFCLAAHIPSPADGILKAMAELLNG